MGATLKINTRDFRATLTEYRKVSRRDLATILNTKAFYIARGAVRNTVKADRNKIRADLNSPAYQVDLKGKNPTATDFPPLAAAIINSRRGKAGLKGLYGADMRAAIRSLINARQRSRAFVASGFIAAIKKFFPLAERKSQAPRNDSTVKQYGQAKGSAVVATDASWKMLASITNTASGPRETRDALERYGGPALQQAVNDEVRSMKQYMLDKFSATAKKFSAKP